MSFCLRKILEGVVWGYAQKSMGQKTSLKVFIRASQKQPGMSVPSSATGKPDCVFFHKDSGLV